MTSQIAAEGWIVSRRVLGQGLAFLTLGSRPRGAGELLLTEVVMDRSNFAVGQPEPSWLEALGAALAPFPALGSQMPLQLYCRVLGVRDAKGRLVALCWATFGQAPNRERPASLLPRPAKVMESWLSADKQPWLFATRDPSSDMKTLFGTVATGLEDVAEHEVRQLLAPATVAVVSGKVFFEIPTHTIGLLPQLRCMWVLTAFSEAKSV
eukprot:COSAG05_NODE_1379_length_5040_cov_46.838292_1_plen_209_part_00